MEQEVTTYTVMVVFKNGDKVSIQGVEDLAGVHTQALDDLYITLVGVDTTLTFVGDEVLYLYTVED